MNYDDLNQFLKDTLHESEIQPATPIAQVEQRITEKYQRNREQKRKKQRQMLSITATAIVLLIVCGSFLAPPTAYALKERILHSIVSLGHNLVLKYSNHGDAPEPSRKIEQEVAKIQPEVPFTILIPQYVPAGFQFERIEKNADDQQLKVMLSFKSPDASLLLTQSKITGKRSRTVNINGKEAEADTVEIGRYEGYLMTFADGSCNLIWISEDNIEYGLFGGLNPEQAKEMAVSMQ